MANIFNLENFDDFSEKINIEDLYDKKRKLDIQKLELFKKILNRIHVRIKTTAKNNVNEKFCWFIVPEVIIGVPKYDQGSCIAYLFESLKENGFNVRYFHPNTLFICWDHWVPQYIRNEIKKKTGIEINEYGEKINVDNDNEQLDEIIPQVEQIKNSKKYTPIKSYKPIGNLVYSEDILNKTGDKNT